MIKAQVLAGAVLAMSVAAVPQPGPDLDFVGTVKSYEISISGALRLQSGASLGTMLSEHFSGSIDGRAGRTRADEMAALNPSPLFTVIDVIERNQRVQRTGAGTVVSSGKTTMLVAVAGKPVERTFRYRRVWEAKGYRVECVLQEISELSEKPAPAFKPPFVLMRFENVCGFGMPDGRALNQCASYQVWVNGDGVVRYDGGWGVLTLGHKTHKAPVDSAAGLIADALAAGLFEMDDEFRGIPGQDHLGRDVVTTVSHANAATLVMVAGGRSKRIYDFYGAPAPVKAFEARVYAATDARRYTGRPFSR